MRCGLIHEGVGCTQGRSVCRVSRPDPASELWLAGGGGALQVSLGEGDPQQGSQLVSWGASWSRITPKMVPCLRAVPDTRHANSIYTLLLSLGCGTFYCVPFCTLLPGVC